MEPFPGKMLATKASFLTMSLQSSQSKNAPPWIQNGAQIVISLKRPSIPRTSVAATTPGFACASHWKQYGWVECGLGTRLLDRYMKLTASLRGQAEVIGRRFQECGVRLVSGCGRDWGYRRAAVPLYGRRLRTRCLPLSRHSTESTGLFKSIC